MKEVTAKNYLLRTDTGSWLGQIILTTDGMFASVTDYGNLSFAWRDWGYKDFREFLCALDIQYFGGKMYQGNTYILYSPKCKAACMRFAEHILPALQKVLKAELELEKNHV